MCCPRPKQGRHRRFPLRSHCQARRNCRGITPPPRWQSRTGNPSSSRLNCSCWLAVREVLVAFTFADKKNVWVAVTVGDWNELKEGGDGPPAGGCNCLRRGTSQREDRDGVGALAADQDIEEPVGLVHHVDRTGQRGSSPRPPVAATATLKPLPCGPNKSTTPSARATTTCPLGRACAATTCWPE